MALVGFEPLSGSSILCASRGGPSRAADVFIDFSLFLILVEIRCIPSSLPCPCPTLHLSPLPFSPPSSLHPHPLCSISLALAPPTLFLSFCPRHAPSESLFHLLPLTPPHSLPSSCLFPSCLLLALDTNDANSELMPGAPRRDSAREYPV